MQVLKHVEHGRLLRHLEQPSGDRIESRLTLLLQVEIRCLVAPLRQW